MSRLRLCIAGGQVQLACWYIIHMDSLQACIALSSICEDDMKGMNARILASPGTELSCQEQVCPLNPHQQDNYSVHMCDTCGCLPSVPLKS